MEIQDDCHTWKFIFCFFHWTERPIDLKLGRNHRGDLLIKKRYNCLDRKAKMATMVAILKIFFSASSPESKDRWTGNIVGSIGVTCRSKVAKILPIRNPRWLYHDFRSKIAIIIVIGSPRWPPSWKPIFLFFFWTKRPTDSKLGRKHEGDL